MAIQYSALMRDFHSISRQFTAQSDFTLGYAAICWLLGFIACVPVQKVVPTRALVNTDPLTF